MIGWIACVCALWTNARVQAQESVTAVGSLNDSIAVRQPDSLLKIAADSTLRADTATVDTTARKKSMLEAPVTYQASDSIVLTGTNMAYLYGESNVKYQNIELQAERIEMSMDSSIVYATFALDSVGAEYGYPLFVEGEQQIEAKSMRYNFRSRKAYANEVLTQQGEGFLTAGVTKKMPDDAMNLINGRYTTCDEHDHPHFYIKMTKAKVRPGKDIVTGPAYLVIEDVPLFPIGLPFGFFPFSSTYSSGIIMPTYGDEMARGFNLRNGGYYFAISDYIDLALTSEIYTKGSWGLAARSSYRKRYKYSGSVDASYLVTKTGDKGLPDYSVSKDFRIAWTHSQPHILGQCEFLDQQLQPQSAQYVVHAECNRQQQGIECQHLATFSQQPDQYLGHDEHQPALARFVAERHPARHEYLDEQYLSPQTQTYRRQGTLVRTNLPFLFRLFQKYDPYERKRVSQKEPHQRLEARHAACDPDQRDVQLRIPEHIALRQLYGTMADGQSLPQVRYGT